MGKTIIDTTTMPISINKYFYVMSFGVLLNVSAYTGILTLQSSIHVEDFVGTTSASILYITAALLSLFATPVMLLHVGAKWSLIIGETGFVLYSISNFYPTLSSMSIGALFGAFGEALIWPAGPLYIDIILRDYRMRYRATGSIESERNRWYGSFYGILQSCLIWGNLISYVTLYSARNLNSDHMLNTTKKYMNASNCGSQFHRDQIGDAQLFKYVPQSMASVYLMLSIFLFLQIVAVVIHCSCLPSVGLNDPVLLGKRVRHAIVDAISATFAHLKDPNQLILIPMNLYFGFVQSYSRAVFSQAFVSCALGVQMLGLVMMIYGLANATTAAIAGQVAFRYGVLPLVLFAFFFDLGNYAVQYMWVPTYDTRFLIFAIAPALGISEGLWQFTVIALAAKHFEKQQEIAFGTLNLWIELAVFVGFLLAPRIAVSNRILLMTCFLLLSVNGFAVVHDRKMTEEREKVKERENMEQVHFDSSRQLPGSVNSSL